MFWILISYAFAQSIAVPEDSTDSLLQLEQILYALERVHPEIVNEVTRETHDHECAAALQNASPQTAAPLAVCIRTSEAHGVNIEDVQSVLSDLKARYPGMTRAYSTEFWLKYLTEARKELRIQQALEREAAEQAEQVYVDSLRERSSLLGNDSGMTPVP